MTDKNPDKECKIEYVDAEPIEGTGTPSPNVQQWPRGASPMSQGQHGSDGQPHVYTYYHKAQGCGPCCGPVGCGLLIAVALMVLGHPELLKGVLFAIAIMALVSMFSQIFLTRR